MTSSPSAKIKKGEPGKRPSPIRTSHQQRRWSAAPSSACQVARQGAPRARVRAWRLGRRLKVSPTCRWPIAVFSRAGVRAPTGAGRMILGSRTPTALDRRGRFDERAGRPPGALRDMRAPARPANQQSSPSRSRCASAAVRNRWARRHPSRSSSDRSTRLPASAWAASGWTQSMRTSALMIAACDDGGGTAGRATAPS